MKKTSYMKPEICLYDSGLEGHLLNNPVSAGIVNNYTSGNGEGEESKINVNNNPLDPNNPGGVTPAKSFSFEIDYFESDKNDIWD